MQIDGFFQVTFHLSFMAEFNTILYLQSKCFSWQNTMMYNSNIIDGFWKWQSYHGEGSLSALFHVFGIFTSTLISHSASITILGYNLFQPLIRKVLYTVHFSGEDCRVILVPVLLIVFSLLPVIRVYSAHNAGLCRTRLLGAVNKLCHLF